MVAPSTNRFSASWMILHGFGVIMGQHSMPQASLEIVLLAFEMLGS